MEIHAEIKVETPYKVLYDTAEGFPRVGGGRVVFRHAHHHHLRGGGVLLATEADAKVRGAHALRAVENGSLVHEFLGDASHIDTGAAEAPRGAEGGGLDKVQNCDFGAEFGSFLGGRESTRAAADRLTGPNRSRGWDGGHRPPWWRMPPPSYRWEHWILRAHRHTTHDKTPSNHHSPR